MSGPLVPVPHLPLTATTGGDVVIVEATSYGTRAGIALGDIARPNADKPSAYVDAEHAPAVAAALLAAAGREHHRVIDLGGPLAKVTRDGDRLLIKGTGRYVNEAFSDEVRMDEVVANLAVLEARAAASSHDPAEVAAAVQALAGARDLTWPVAPAEDEVLHRDARAVLDALAAVRAEAGR